MDIKRYIHDLLYLHDCVIIPGFGGFVANYKAAEINFEQNTFAPPSKAISFNKNLNNNDGLLIGHISERTGTGYVDVKKMVDDFVGNTLKNLEKGKRINFEDIGHFQYDKQRNLQFEPENSSNYLIDSYGLSWFQMAPLEPYDVTKRIQKKFTDREPVPRKGMSKTVRRLLIGIPVLVILVLIPLKTKYFENLNIDFSSINPFNKNRTEEIKEPVEVIVNEADIFYEDAIETTGTVETTLDPDDNIKQEVSETVDEKADISIEDPDVQPVGIEQSEAFYIIAGSFSEKINANQLQAELQKSGFESVIFDADNGLFRVSIGNYPDRPTALVALDKLRKIPGRETVWLLKN